MVSAVTADITGKGEVPTSQRPSLILIPWDPDSPEHVDRLVQQRIACGWKREYVENWQDQQREGKIGLHWVVSAETGRLVISSGEILLQSEGQTVHIHMLQNATPLIDLSTIAPSIYYCMFH